MGKRGGGRKPAAAVSSLVRAEEAAEEEILETPALSSFAAADANDSDDDDEADEDEEAEIERRLVEEKLREEQEAANSGSQESKGVYNREAIEALIAEWDTKPLAWVETLDTCKFPLELADVHDDLKREVAFYNNTLASVKLAKERLKKENIAYKRPEDYFAEMLKSDAHMAKVKDKLIYEQKKIAAVEERKKSQAHRKVAKELQAEKLKQRAQQKKDTLEAVKQWKKRRNQNGGAGDDNDEDLDAIVNGGNANKKRKRDNEDAGSNKKPRVNKKRESKNNKYGFGGPKRHAKSNTRDSTNDFSQFGRRGKPGKAKPKAATGGKRAGKAARASQRQKARR